jgi:hypothetical protein
MPDSPMSPTRPQSLRKRQSLHIMDLESRVNSLSTENRTLQDARTRAEQAMLAAHSERDTHAQTVRHATQAVATRDVQIRDHQDQIRELRDQTGSLQSEVDRLAQENARLTEHATSLTNTRSLDVTGLQEKHDDTHRQWQESLVALAALQASHKQLSEGMDQTVREQVSTATTGQSEEIAQLQAQLAASRSEIQSLQQQILATQTESYLTFRDEDYIDTACQKLCQHVQQWVLRFSKFSDNAKARLTNKIKDQTLEDKLDDTMLDGSDVDDMLQDRIYRRNVFMSLVMGMIFDHIFSRYLFGLDQDQRGKLKKLEKTLSDVGPPEAVSQWRAITLTLLSRRPAFQEQSAQDTLAVAHEIFDNLNKILPCPTHLRNSSFESLRKVLRLAVDLSVEMRTQKAKYVMYPMLRPEWDENGNLVKKCPFNASLMHEKSGEFASNEELEAQGAIVQIVLFPLVIKEGDDTGGGTGDEFVICPAQVVVQRPPTLGKKVVRMQSALTDMPPMDEMELPPAEPRGSNVSFGNPDPAAMEVENVV